MRVLMGLMFVLWAASAQAELRIGILSPLGPEQATARWTPFVELLSRELDTPIQFYPVSAQEGTNAFFENHIDVLLGNPVQSAVVVDTMQAQPLVSMISHRGAEFAGVIAVAANSSILTPADLQGKRIATLGDWAAGGYLFQTAYLMQHGLPAPAALGSRVRGPNQHDLVAQVLSGDADAAFIRTGVIEGLIAKGVLGVGDLRVLKDQKRADGDLHRTTPWYPEWLMSARKGLDPELAAQLRDALLNIDGQHPASKNAKVKGFQDPLSLREVINAMQLAEVAPYN